MTTRTINEVSRALLLPFKPSLVSWRLGATNQKKRARETGDKYAKPTSGIALAYIDARDVMKRLDQVVGVNGWENNHPYPGACNLGLLMPCNPELGTLSWVWKANAAGKTQVEAEKGEASDSFKRAAVMFGVGRCYYDLPNTWHELNSKGQLDSAVKKDLSDKMEKWSQLWCAKNINGWKDGDPYYI